MSQSIVHKELTQTELEEYLLERGIRIKVGGCGCCSSPWLTVWFDDVPQPYFDESDVNIDMEPK